MANSFYTLGIDAFLQGSIAYSSDTIKAALVSSASYTPNLTTDQFLNIIPGGAIIAAGVALTSKTHAGGTASAANTVWTAVSGTAAAYIAIYKDTGLSSSSPLICLLDTATGLPVTPNGGDITAAWNSGQVFIIKQGLSDRDRSAVERFADWLREVAGIPARLGEGGLWIPEPRIVLA